MLLACIRKGLRQCVLLRTLQAGVGGGVSVAVGPMGRSADACAAYGPQGRRPLLFIFAVSRRLHWCAACGQRTRDWCRTPVVYCVAAVPALHLCAAMMAQMPHTRICRGCQHSALRLLVLSICSVDMISQTFLDAEQVIMTSVLLKS